MIRIPSHYLVAASAWGCRSVTAVAQIVSIRILMQSLGSEQYALYALLAALLPWFQLGDMGIGFSLQNFISEKRARQESVAAYMAAAFIGLGLLLIGLLVVFQFLSSQIASTYLGGVAPTLAAGLKVSAVRIALVCSILSGIGGVSYKIWYGQQRGYLTNIVQGGAALVGLLALLMVQQLVASPEQRLVGALYAFFLPQSLLPLIALLAQSRGLAQGGQTVNGTVVRQLSLRSLKFFFLAVMGAVTLQVDYFVLARFLQSTDIVVYNLCTKLFVMIYFIYNALIIAFWPTCAEALARQEWGYVGTQLRKLLGMGLGYVVLATGLFLVFAEPVMQLLSPGYSVTIPPGFIVLTGVYYLLRAWTDTFAMVLQSISYLRPFYLFVPVQALLSAGLQVVLAPRWGIYGIMAGLIASFVLTVGWGLPLTMYSIVRRKG